MRITIYCIGKKHDPLYVSAIQDYSSRVERSVTLRWELLPPSGQNGSVARDEESEALLKRVVPTDIVWLLDETGKIISSPELSEQIAKVQQTGQDIIIIIGGAFGVNQALKQRANFIWSLSKLVFPHQLVRVLVAEQLYRSYEILRGSGYHHV